MEYSTVVEKSDMPFQFFFGGRGIGKTFSILSLCDSFFTDLNKLMWMRRTETEVQTAVAEDLFKKHKSKGTCVDCTADYKKSVGYGRIMRGETNIGYVAPLSTFANIRGVDSFADISHCAIDELSPESHKSFMKEEGLAILNMMESLSRNREIEGLPPVKYYFLSNAVRLDLPILIELDLVSVIQKMLITGRKTYTNRNRGLYIEIMDNKALSEAKGETSLYKLSGKCSRFYRQAIDNKFIFDDLSIVRKVRLVEYNPILQYGKYCFYVHKSNGTLHIAQNVEHGAKYHIDMTQDTVLCEMFGVRFRQAFAYNMLTVDNYNTFIVVATALNFKLK